MKRSYVTAAAIAIAVAAWLGSGLIFDGDGNTPEPGSPAPRTDSAADALAQVQVRTVVAEEHVRALAMFARTEAVRMVELKAETSARVVEQAVREGDWVEKGDLVIRLAMDDRAEKLDEAKALVAQREIAYEAALKLAKKKFRSKVTLAEEKALLESARAQLAASRLDIARTQIRAPYRGIVDAFVAEVGDLVDVNGPVAQLVDLDPILVVAQVTERDSVHVQPGTEADVRFAIGETARGVVRHVSRMGEAATRTFRVEVEIANSDGAIPEGITAQLRFPLETRMAHRLSPAVLTLDDAGKVGVKMVDDDGRVRFVPVALIDDTSEGIWLAGLPTEVRVIVVGQEFVREGQQVVPVPELRAPGAGAGGQGAS